MNSLKRIVSLLLTITLVFSMASVAFAGAVNFSNPHVIGDGGGDDVPPGSNLGGISINSDFNKGEAGTLISVVLGFIQYIGYAVAVGMLLYIGIKYMMASAADKADLKKGAINYVIGAVLIGGASTVAGFLVTILK